MSARKEKRTRLSWTRAAGSATAISWRSRRRAPHAGSAICTSATASARTSEKCPSSTIMGGSRSRTLRADRARAGPHGAGRRLEWVRQIFASWPHVSIDFAGVFPNALRLQGFCHFRRHVVFVVFGKYDVGKEMPSAIELAFDHDAWPLAEEIRKDASVADRDGLGRIGDGTFDVHAGAALEATLGHEAAQANALARRDGSFGHLLWCEEEDDGVAQGDRDEEHGERKHRDGEEDKHGTTPLAGHGWGPRAWPSAPASLTLSGEPNRPHCGFPRRHREEGGAGRGRRRFSKVIMSRGRGFWRARRVRPTPSRRWGSAAAPGQARRGRHPCG